MTLRPLPRSRLAHLVPSLVHGQALVALVPATGELRWAAQAAWDVARAAARDAEGLPGARRRRVALVDLWVEEPLLHEVAGVQPCEGIVDAFKSGGSLNECAHEVNGVFFIPAGSYPTSAGDVFSNPRWRKLHAGFRSEEALLLVYLSADALARLSAVPDGVIALAPQGVEPASPAGQALTAAADRGAPLLGVVRERYVPAGPPSSPPVPLSVPERGNSWRPPSPEGRGGQGVRILAAALGIALMAAGGWALFARSAEQPHPPLTPPAPPALPVSQPRDTLAWTIQLAAYGTLEGALGHADALAAEEIPALVAPIVLSGSSSVWYRVLAGGYTTRDSAASGRARLWARGAAPNGQGDLLRAPYSLLLAPSLPPDSLRLLGVPATRWPDGRTLLGAFETPEQAAVAEALAAQAGAQATLVTRTGRVP